MQIKHRHLQLNIKQTMSSERVRSDVARAFSLKPDTIVFNECLNVAHQAIRDAATDLGYEVFIPQGSFGQVVLVWRADLYECVSKTVTKAMSGRKRVTPHRGVVKARLRRRAGVTGVKRRLVLVGTHMVASGWTGSKHLDAWRQRGWYKHYAVMALILKVAYRANSVVLWSGDMNRPPSTFKKGKPFAAFQVSGASTSKVVHTDATHGRTTFDYCGVLSRNRVVTVERWSTPAFESDHDGILVDFEWEW